ncbi:MAG TPA: alpha/beta hydrolase [Verrucomicrobiales bacterium]|nr:alpha/beta hydrolase [Verrucomicrobiales bacterium]
MPNIPGDPAFDGTLAEDGESIAGNFSQAGQTHTFKLARTEKKPEKGETPSKGTPGEGFAGVWQGSLRVNIVELRLLFKIQEEGGALSGTVDSIDQNANGIAITKATSAGGGRKLHLEVSSIGGTFDGELSADGSEIVGEWKQGGNTLPLTIRRLEKAPDLSRPQDPKQPVPYLEEEVAFENRSAGIKLAGTFTSPKSAGPHPAVVLISGSGAQDRDEAIMGHRPFLVLADHLTRHGIAVLRFDDRGVGKSEGSFSKATTKDFATDALAAVEHLKTRSNVDAKNIGLIGHSEGGIVAPMAAVQSQDVAFIVLLAGVGVPMEELLVRQGQDLLRVMGGSDEMITSQSATQREVFRIVREFGGTPLAEQKAREAMDKALKEFKPEQLEAMGWNEAQMDGQIKMVLSPWFRELLALDPRPTLEKVRCPVLALNGEKDIQVAAKENLEAIESALKRGGNTRVTVREFPGLNHLFQTCTTGAIAEYGLIEETFNPKALTAISDWIRSTTGLQ